VVAAAFVLAAFGWGIGFYGPPVFLGVIVAEHGWPPSLVAGAISAHFLVGAVAGAGLPHWHRRFSIPAVTKAAALSLAIGVVGWANATAAWQLFVAAAVSGAGWAAMSAAAVNAIVSPWFVHKRPAALAMAYNGGSIGGVVFSPLWVAAIAMLGFPIAAAAIGSVMALTIWLLADIVFSRTPRQMGMSPDGEAALSIAAPIKSRNARPLPGASLWRDGKFLTLAAGMGLGLFAQIGLVAHLFSLLVPALGPQQAGWAMSLATALAICGRSLVGWLMRATTDRRLMAALSYAVQMAGSLVFVLAAGSNVPLLLLGIALFGIGFGNATSLPPLIAQVEFAEEDVQRVVALIVAFAQAAYAFAPAVFGLIRVLAPPLPGAGAAPALFVVAALVQGLAIAAMLSGRR
jgi:MFS family permease